MHEAKSLESVLKKHLIMNAARINFTAGFILALLKTGTVNFKKIALAFPGKAAKDSKYKRIQRFFASFPLDLEMIAQLIVELTPVKLSRWLLSIDRTNWKFGKMNINILTLGIVYMDIAFPVLWIPLDKRGNSNTKERITLMERFISLFGLNKIQCIVADREFIGTLWFEFLLKVGIKFRIRIKENNTIPNSRNIQTPAKRLFRGLKPGTTQVLKGKRTVMGHDLYIVGSKLPTGEYLILVTDSDPGKALADYKKRWGIETLFGCLKTRGFNFESTHLTKLKRIEKLVGLLAIAFTWCHIIGEWKNEKKAITIKNHGRKAISIFRCGFDDLREILFNISERFGDFQRAIEILFRNLAPDFRLLNRLNKYKENFLSCT